jgi:hypothetical protein
MRDELQRASLVVYRFTPRVRGEATAAATAVYTCTCLMDAVFFILECEYHDVVVNKTSWDFSTRSVAFGVRRSNSDISD